MSATASTAGTAGAVPATAGAVPGAPALPAAPRQRLVNGTYLRLEVRRILRNRRTAVFTLVMPVIFYFSFGVTQRDPAARAYVMISLAVYGAVVAATSSGAAVSVERASGWSRQLRLTPLLPGSYVVMKVLAALTISALPILVQFAVGAVTGVRMDALVWVLAGIVAWLGSVTFAALGLALGYLLPSENVMQFVGVILTALAFLGGLFIPISQYSHTMQDVAHWTPAYGVGSLARHALSGEGSIGGALADAVLWTVVFAVAAALLFRRDTARV
jgi:ABC-2 type transport system permease protein